MGGVTKIEVLDAAAFSRKDPVRVATAAILPNAPAAAGGPGIGKTITSTGGAGVQLVIDGTNIDTNDRVLVKDEALGGGLGGANNGIYVCNDDGTGANPWQLTRADDYNTAARIDVSPQIPVNAGTVNHSRVYEQTNVGLIVIDVTVLTFDITANNLDDVPAAATIGGAATRIAGNLPVIEISKAVAFGDIPATVPTSTVAFDTGLPLDALPLGGRIHVSTNFIGTGIATVTADIGSPADPDIYIDGANIQAGAVVDRNDGGIMFTQAAYPLGAHVPIITVTGNVALNNLRGGAMTAYLYYVVVQR